MKRPGDAPAAVERKRVHFTRSQGPGAASSVLSDINDMIDEYNRTASALKDFVDTLKNIRQRSGQLKIKRDTARARTDQDTEARWNECAALLDSLMDPKELEELEAILEPQTQPQPKDPAMEQFIKDREDAVAFFLNN